MDSIIKIGAIHTPDTLQTLDAFQVMNVDGIDPDSPITVRRKGVEENVEKIKASIQRNGYWSEQLIVVRPHPDSGSKYDYQIVAGQCRLKACLALGLKEIPGLMLELDDDTAMQCSWIENEIRGNLAPTDKAYWIEKIYKRYISAGHTVDEAIELTAKYLGTSVQEVNKILLLRLESTPC